jgi:4-aminobutyrate aminotransferase/(S)-3-amino-2-methylpropionate transaminase
VAPSDVKIELLDRLAELAPWPNAKVILGLNGADAIDAALKTAALATGRPGVVAFDGGYHGLGFAALSICGYSDSFRAPFQSQLNPHVSFAPWPSTDGDLEGALRGVEQAIENASAPVGAIVVEPIQGRGGVRFPPPGFLVGLRELSDRHGAILVMDEIYVGLGRAGARWVSVETGVLPDLLCAGKALGGGFPVSACLGHPDVMQHWGAPDKEALHTATFLGQPIGCAAAIAALDVMDNEALFERSRVEGSYWLSTLRQAFDGDERIVEIRGQGMMVAIEFAPGHCTLALVQRLLRRGFITLPCGQGASALQLSPPITTSRELLELFVVAVSEELA